MVLIYHVSSDNKNPTFTFTFCTTSDNWQPLINEPHKHNVLSAISIYYQHFHASAMVPVPLLLMPFLLLVHQSEVISRQSAQFNCWPEQFRKHLKVHLYTWHQHFFDGAVYKQHFLTYSLLHMVSLRIINGYQMNTQSCLVAIFRVNQC